MTMTRARVEPQPSDLLAALQCGAVVCTLDLHQVPLADAHVVEAIACALGAIAAPAVEVECRNCHEKILLEGASALPLDPLLSPPGDPELDPPVDRDEEHPLPRAVPIRRRATANTFRLLRRTLDDRVKLQALLAGSTTLPLGPQLVRAMGLGALGEMRSPSAIARALERLDDDAFDDVWDAIAQAWDAQHYPPRLLAAVGCPLCGARHDIEVPPHRPFSFGRPVNIATETTFPPLDVFRTRAAQIAREVIESIGLTSAQGLEVVVEEGVPPCDDGGEPLLGSYTPTPEADGDVRLASTSPFTVALYYQTFRAMYEEDGPYDVDGEIRETLDHELTHHLGFLQGDDPLDEQERQEIDRERLRLLGNPAKSRQFAEGVGWLAGDFGRFWRLTWPVWILVLAALLIVIASSR